MKTIILLGTSNPTGNTRQFADALAKKLSATLYDISDYDIFFYDYQHRNQYDDFLRIFEDVLEYDLVIFASPVYWYAMSAQMKMFFDRTTDLLEIRKDLGRRLKGKYCAVISTGVQPTAPDCFIEPFKLTAQYFEMPFIDHFYSRYATTENDLTNQVLMLRQVDHIAEQLFPYRQEVAQQETR